MEKQRIKISYTTTQHHTAEVDVRQEMYPMLKELVGKEHDENSSEAMSVRMLMHNGTPCTDFVTSTITAVEVIEE